MPIEIDKVLGAELPETEAAWSEDDVILYHLGLGAGDPPTAPGELEYVWERQLKVLPSYAVIPVMPTVLAMMRMPGMDIDLAALLHGEQELDLHEAVPARCSVRTSARVTHIFDKGKAALVGLEAQSHSTDDGRLLFTNRFRAFIQGEGGFGGDAGPPAQNESPARPPDHVTERKTMPQQGLLYRLSGDKNPLHVDPELARRAGLDRPILHGLCSFGIACRAAVDVALGGDPAAVAGYAARFAGVFFPGETLAVSIWDDGDRLLLEAHAKEREALVLSNAVIRTR